MAEIIVTENNFESEVLKSEIPVLVDFWAAWCGPCRMLAPVLSEIAQEQEGMVKVAKINVDEHPGLAMQFRVASIPTLVVMKDGKVVSQSSGARPKAQILKLLEG